MSAAMALRRPGSERRVSLFDAPSRELTLAELLARAWEDLGGVGHATCPVCGGEMQAQGSSAAGSCTACRTVLS